MKQDNYWAAWQQNRLNFILEKYDKSFFKGKSVLELGSCNGFFGNFFQSIGSDVVIYEGRQENVDYIKNRYPNLTKVYQKDLDTAKWDLGQYDIIINFGLLYHLHYHHAVHLENCIANCELMFLETVVYDSFRSEISFKSEWGFDQSLSKVGGTPSTSYIEDIFTKNNVSFEKFTDSSLNGDIHKYDWVDSDRKIRAPHTRRFWILKK